MHDSARPVRPVSFPTEFNHDVPLLDWDEDDESNRNTSDDCMSDEGDTDNDVVDDRSVEPPVHIAYADAFEIQPVGSVQRGAIIRMFLIDVGLLESSLSGDVPEFCGYVYGWLRLYGHPSLGLISC